MMRIVIQSSSRLELTNAPPRIALVFVVLLMIFGGAVAWGAIGAMGGFGWLMAILWVAFCVLILKAFIWNSAIFDVNAGTLEVALHRLTGSHRAAIDLSELDLTDTDQIEVWARLLAAGMPFDQIRQALILRRVGKHKRDTRVTSAIQSILSEFRRKGDPPPQA